MPYYAVKIGKTPGIYTSWRECKENITGVEKVVFKKFELETEAIDFMNKDINIEEDEERKLLNTSTIVDKTFDLTNCTNIYVDGSCINGGTKEAIGSIGIYFGPNDSKNEKLRIESDPKEKLTTNRLELKAILYGITKVLTEIVEKKTIVIHTDCEYSISALTSYTLKNKISKNIPNYDYINKGIYLLNRYPNIKLKYTKGVLNSKSIHSEGIFGANKLSNIALRRDLNKVLFNFGKYKDRSFGEIYSIDQEYFDWCLLSCKSQFNEVKLFLQSKDD